MQFKPLSPGENPNMDGIPVGVCQTFVDVLSGPLLSCLTTPINMAYYQLLNKV
jgi:hypothetical protein